MMGIKGSIGVLSVVLVVGSFHVRFSHCQLIMDYSDDGSHLSAADNAANFYHLDESSQEEHSRGTGVHAYNWPQQNSAASDYYYGLLQDQNGDKSEISDRIVDELLDFRFKQHQQQQQANEPAEVPLSLADDSYSDLLSQLSNVQQQQQKRQKSEIEYHYHDVNSHLPAMAVAGNDWPTKPVNDPEEFEAKLSQLTNVLNHNMANTQERHEMLVGLLNRSHSVLNSSKSEADDATNLRPPLNGLSSTSQLNVDRLVGRIDKWLEELTNGKPQQQEQHRHHQEHHDDDLDLSRYGGSEYIDHPLMLTGHQYVQGGAGEGYQMLGPDGTYENVQVIKTDSAIPSYCDPPNPCPLGYTANDGCLEDFVNSASFSREYQARQQCSCDNEHSLFNCAAPAISSSSSPSSSTQQQQRHVAATTTTTAATITTSTSSSTNDAMDPDRHSSFELTNKLGALARTIQDRFGGSAIVRKLMGEQRQQQEDQTHNRQNEVQEQFLAGNDDVNSDYLIRSARKLSSLDMHHKVELD